MMGARLGPYRVLRELGSGGMATVHLAEVAEAGAIGLPRGDRVALKVFHPHLFRRRDFFKRFLQEARIGGRIRHPNVVRILDADAQLSRGRLVPYLAMEYVQGRSLAELLGREGPLPESCLRDVARQVASGLEAIHAEDIVHRDLKPENILVAPGGRICIIDLGVAKLRRAALALSDLGNFAGSVAYMAPEQFRDGETGPSADLYALGVTLYELATGENPFRFDDAGASIHAHLSVAPRPAHAASPELSRPLSRILEALLAKRPADRFPSARALGDALEAAEGSAWRSRGACARNVPALTG